MRKLSKFCLVALPLFLAACDPVSLMVGGTVVAGTVTVRDKEGITGQISDAYLKEKIRLALLNKDKELYDRVELAVKHGIVVVIGSFDDESQCERVKEIVGTVQVKDVYYETRVEPQAKVGTFAADAGITTRIEASMKSNGNVASLNYDTTTVNGIVYMCGTAMTAYERDVVLNIARSTSGVVKVVSYIKIAKPEVED
ncbi:MAG: BON domain-containing protein [Alphaproteobacteria bacterium]|nr:BON domain-containing protein [Alphaproteobacteria bacterium]